MSEAPELKPCPFCGGTAKYEPIYDDEAGIRIEHWCGMPESIMGVFIAVEEDTREEAGIKWNTRTDLSEAALAAARRAALQEAADICLSEINAHQDMAIHGSSENARNREAAANIAERIRHKFLALMNKEQSQ